MWKTCRKVAIFFCVISFPSTLFAYNFLSIHPTTGEPISWEIGVTIRYYLDPGSLGRLTNDQAHTLLKEAMKIWENASPDANVPRFEFVDYLSEDVNGENYGKYINLNSCYGDDLASCPTEAQRNLQTVIVFDEDNSILDNQLCRISSCDAYGKAGVISGSAADPQKIVQGIVVLGEYLGSDSIEVSQIMDFMVHELGHLLGLAHTSLNEQVEFSDFGPNPKLMPTMFTRKAEGVDGSNAVLHPDDIAGISVLYPSDTFVSTTATVKGDIFKSDLTHNVHVNVIARMVDDPLCEAYSFLNARSVNFTSERYAISGLPPGTYTIEVEEVDDNIGSALSPGLLSSEDIFGDAEFWNEGDAVAEDNMTSSAITLVAGETRENVDIILNRSEVTEDRIKYIPLDTFTPGPGTRCPEEPPVDYAALIGIDESGDSGSTGGDSSPSGGCGLVRQ